MDDDEEALRWTTLEKLPTRDRVRRAIIFPLPAGDDAGTGHQGLVDVDVLSLGPGERRALLERLVRVADEDHERFLVKLRERLNRYDDVHSISVLGVPSLLSCCCCRWIEELLCCRVGIDMPTIEVRFEHLNVEAEVRVGSSGIPTVLNSITNTLEEAATALHLLRSRKRALPILHDVSGIIKPRRYGVYTAADSSVSLFNYDLFTLTQQSINQLINS
jgi:hypothetical protein